MSTIDKLHIMGIRNFGPDEKDKAIIKFSSPLTLILGRNGCGKTTIIEALKYAACGEIPAGTEGGSGFVHDPELVNTHVVRGQVKLRCYSTKGEPNTVVRTVQVTRKSKKLEFKTLDSTITSGDNKSISERCADIDATMCHNLGVSKAVLTNVIFCHQEDSAWPLEKGKKIKERFDAIFGITEYNKCLDYIRTLAKETTSKLGVLKNECGYKEKYREDAEQKRKKLADDKSRLTAIHDQVEELNNKKDPIDNKIREIRQKLQNFVKFAAKVESMKSKRKLINDQINTYKQDIKEAYKGSKEELLCEIASFAEDLKNKENRLRSLGDDKQNAISEEKRLQNDISVKQMFLGKLQTNDQQNDDNISRRNQLLRNLAEELDVPIVSSNQLSESGSSQLHESVDMRLRELSRQVENLQDEQESLEKSLQKKIDDVFEKKTRIETDVKSKTRTIAETKSKIQNVNREIDEINRSSEGLGELAKKMDDLKKEKETVTDSLNEGQCKLEIENIANQIKKLEQNSSSLYDEIKLLQKVSLQRDQLDSLRKRKKNREAEFKNIKEKHCSSLQHLLGSIPNHNFRSLLEEQLKKLSEEIRKLEKSINEKENKLTDLTVRKSNVDEQLREKRRKCADDECKVEELCRDQHIDSFIEDLNRQIEQAQDIKGTVSASRYLYSKYIEKLKRLDATCPICFREFAEQSEIDRVIKDLENRIKQMPQKEEDNANTLKNLLSRQTRAMDVKREYNSLLVIKNEEIPKLIEEAKSFKESIDAIKTDIEAEQLQLLSPQSDKTLIEGLLSDSTLMDVCQNDIRSLEAEILQVESQLPSSVSAKTLEEANQELENLQSKLSGLRKTLDETQKKLSQYNEKLKRINDEQNTIAAKQLQIAGIVQKRKSLDERLKELEKTETNINTELKHAETQLNPIETELRECKEKLTRVKIDHKRLLGEKKKKLIDYEKKVDEVKKLQSGIDEYHRNGGASRLQTTRTELADLQLRRKEIEARKEELERERETIVDFVKTQQIKKFNLDNSLKLLNKKEELILVEREIEELEGDTKVIDADQLDRNLEKLDREKREIDMKKSNASGRASELQATIRDLERELNRSEYKNAEDEYRKSYVNLMVTAKVIEDMKEYEKGMDWAMIHFHRQSMIKINDTIRELWRAIYRGNDIDWIEIKTEEGGTNAAGKRSFNYRVVQIKNNVEMEMAGRCSAGQKVLACLIIRIALAETFSKNCGILALDEPTTNLDKVNSESLSATLADIVERRSSQRNFQLIVITHDKDFIDKLCHIEKVDQYIVVDRNDRGKSIAVRREV